MGGGSAPLSISDLHLATSDLSGISSPLFLQLQGVVVLCQLLVCKMDWSLTRVEGGLLLEVILRILFVTISCIRSRDI